MSVSDDWMPDEPGPFEQAAEPTETWAQSRRQQWREHMLLFLVVGFLAGAGIVLIVWGYLF